MGISFQRRMKNITVNSPFKKRLFTCPSLLELAEVEAGAVIKIKDSGIAKTGFQHKSYFEVGVFSHSIREKNRFDEDEGDS